MARVDRFDPVSNSARNRQRLPAQHSKLCISAHHENMSKIAKEGEWVVHPPIFSKGMLYIEHYLWLIKFYRIQLEVVPHILPPSKTSVCARFRGWLAVPHYYHPTYPTYPTRTHGHGYGFLQVRVRVRLRYPGVTRDIPYACNHFISFCIQLLTNQGTQQYYTPTLENERKCSFSRAVGSLPPPPPNQCRKRASTLVFDSGWSCTSITTTKSPRKRVS